MNWKDMKSFQKVSFVVFILCGIVVITLPILDFAGVWESIDIVEDIIDCVFALSGCITTWRKKSLTPMLFLFLFVLSLIRVFL